MAMQIVMDRTGDSRHHYDPSDAQEVAKAERRFYELTNVGFTAAARTGPGQVSQIRRPLAIARAAIPPSPLRDRVGYSDHDRFRGYVPVHCRSGSLSTLRNGRYRTPRKTRFAAAR